MFYRYMDSCVVFSGVFLLWFRLVCKQLGLLSLSAFSLQKHASIDQAKCALFFFNIIGLTSSVISKHLS